MEIFRNNGLDFITLRDEYDFWCRVAQDPAEPRLRKELAAVVLREFEPVLFKFEKLDSLDIEDMMELIELTRDFLDVLWRVCRQSEEEKGSVAAYSQQGMTYLLKVLGQYFLDVIRKLVSEVDVWKDPLHKVEIKITEGRRLAEKWEEAYLELTRLTWPSAKEHKWAGDPFRDTFIITLTSRLEEILKLREVEERLRKFLSEDEARSFTEGNVFRCFATLDAYDCSDGAQRLWKAALLDYEKIMQPTEARIAITLREFFRSSLLPSLQSAIENTSDPGLNCTPRPHQVMREFRKYKELFGSPLVAKSLQNEWKTFLTLLQKHTDFLRGQLEEHCGVNSSGGMKDSSGSVFPHCDPRTVVGSLLWLLRHGSKVEETKATALSLAPILKLIPSSEDMSEKLLLQDLRKLQEDITGHKEEKLRFWEITVQEKLKQLSLETCGKLLKFDPTDGHVQVTFDDEFVALIRETRELSTLGFPIDGEILKSVETALRFQKQGMLLKQVANFYNEISTKMIPSQKVIMLQDALRFESILKNPCDTLGRPLLWKNISAVQSYTVKLQEVSRELSNKNRQLQNQHGKLVQIVKRLVNTDLQNHHEQWTNSVCAMNCIFDESERQGFVNLNDWRSHWDGQLCKALEYQYHLGLKKFTDNLAEIEVKLVFKQESLQYEPPFEEIQANHYKEINKYLSLPLTIRGVSNYPDVFQRLVMEVGALPELKALYVSTEELLGRLLEEQKKLTDTVILGTIDLEEFVASKAKNLEDWDLKLKALKSRTKEFEKFPLEIKVGCYKVVTVPAKVALDEQFKRLHKILCDSLREKALEDMSAIESFLVEGHKVLETEIHSVEDLQKNRQSVSELKASTPKILEVRRTCDQELCLLKQISENASSRRSRSSNMTLRCAEGISLSNINSDWESFTAKLSQHEKYLAKQSDRMKRKVEQDLEELVSRLEDFGACWSEFKSNQKWKGDVDDILSRIKEKETVLKDIEGLIETATQTLKSLGSDAPPFPILASLKEEIQAGQQRWEMYGNFKEEMKHFREKDWVAARTRLTSLEDFVLKWRTCFRNSPFKSEMDVQSLQELELYRKCMAIFPYIKGEGWDHHHWAKLFEVLQVQSWGSGNSRVEDLKVGHFLDRAEKLLQAAEAIKVINSQALGEASIKEALHQLVIWGLQRTFTIVQYVPAKKYSQATVVIRDWQELQTEVGDQQLLVRSLKDSPHSSPFKDDIFLWDRRLTMLQQSLQNLNSVQRKWIHLEPIFAKGALPLEQIRFSKVDEEFRTIMGAVISNPVVTNVMEIPRLEESLPQLDLQLDICQRALSLFLEEKRSSFPRFYFIGDDDLLEILGQSVSPVVIQACLGKIFSGVQTVGFSQNFERIISVQSPGGEILNLASGVPVVEEVETWLNALNSKMQLTLRENLQECLRLGHGNQYPCQVLCLAGQLEFTQKCEEALESNSLDTFKQNLRQKLMSLRESGVLRQKALRAAEKALVLDLIHCVDVVDQLLREKASQRTDWTWSRQLRYYPLPTGGAVVRMAGAEFTYSFEYLGFINRLVYTPLSDKCYLVLTQGLRLGYGGNIFGPAGTGKTESVKALGQYLGRQILVFNCDGDFDFKSMGRIFTGILKSGAWGCFDEFNRLEEGVLSAVSQQIQVIQVALRDKVETINFLGKVVKVDHDAAIFVTMNPKSKTYTGRSKLPDNLKSLFRSVTMTLPNSELIAEVNLISEGFRDAKSIGQKLIIAFSFAQEVLSTQHHYDWGLRAVKVVLSMGGCLLHKELMKNEKVSEDMEKRIIVHALLATTLPKLIPSDCARFQQLVSDVFPDVDKMDLIYEDLENAIKLVLEEMKLQVLEPQVQKILQLHLACNQRIGVSLFGPSGTGKTTVWRVLQTALGRSSNQTVKVHVLNPKALSRHQLLGHMDLDTQQWFDGVLTCLARKVAKESPLNKSWIVCDGDVDPEWIESLNSVLDDNRILTLPSGERIQFGSNVNFIFECENLNFASPATVSRTGMIVFSSDDINTSVLLENWLCSLDAKVKVEAMDCVNATFERAVSWATSHANIVPTSKVGTIQNALSHLRDVKSKQDYLRGLALGLGSNMEPALRVEFYAALHDWSGYTFKASAWSDLPALPRYIPKNAEAPKNSSVSMIPVESMAQAAAFIWSWIAYSQPFILVGPEQCGKCTLLEYCFSRLTSTTVITFHCSSQTSVSDIVERLNLACSVSLVADGGKLFLPKDGKNLILFFRDINLLQPDKWKSNQIISFLQQLISYHGFYDKDLDFVRLEKIQFAAALSPPTSDLRRYELPLRFTSIVRLAYMSYPPRSELEMIYNTMLCRVLHDVLPNNTTWNDTTVKDLTGKLLDVYEDLKVLKTQNCQFKNKFSPRHLSGWIQGLRRYKVKEVGVMEALFHEAICVFRDQLRTSEETHLFDRIVSTTFKSQMDAYHSRTSRVFTTWSSFKQEDVGRYSKSKLLHSMKIDEFHSIVAESLASYQRDVKNLTMILFPEVLHRIAKMDRVLAWPGGSLLLIGSNGVGRRSCIALVAHMHAMDLFSPSISRSYNVRAFQSDVKSVIQAAGIEDRQVVLFLEDYQLVDPCFLQIINSLLCGGGLSSLYSSDELQVIMAPLQEQMAREGFTHHNLLSYFLSRIQANLHIVLSMDSRHPDHEARCLKNPAMYRKCTLMRVDSWADKGLLEFLRARFLEIFGSALDEETNKTFGRTMLEIHKSVAKSDSSVTSSHFSRLVEDFITIYGRKKADLTGQMLHLRTGLGKLATAASQVKELSKEAAAQETLLAIKQKQAEDSLHKIGQSMETLTASKSQVEKLKSGLHEEEAQLQSQKKSIEQELRKVQPQVDAARKAVGQIKSDHLSEIRSLKMPPEAIRDVLEGVLLLMGNFDTSWLNMKKFLGSRTVKEEIMNFDARKIKKDLCQDVQKLIAKKSSSFDHATIYHVSVAAAPLAAWVKANLQYAIVLEQIRPLQVNIQELTKPLEASRNRIQQCEENLKGVDSGVAALKIEFGARTGEVEAVKINLLKATAKVASARELLAKLSGEKLRWENHVADLERELSQLGFSSLMAAAYITYLIPKSEDCSQTLLLQWQTMHQTGSDIMNPSAVHRKRTSGAGSFDFKKFMSSESQILHWKTAGLPSDDLTIENAIVVHHTNRCRFITDPLGQAAAWLISCFKAEQLPYELVGHKEPRFTTALQLAVRFGKRLVVQDVDEIEPMLFPLLRNDLDRQGSKWTVTIGGKVVDFDEKFQLYLLTREIHPHVPPDALALVSQADFTVTQAGLQKQLLTLTLRHERPELEEQQDKLIRSEEKLRLQLLDLEKQLLEELSASQGDVLENQTVFDSLNEMKMKSKNISKSLEDLRSLQESVNERREVFEPYARMGASIFFLLHDLVLLNCMYCFGLAWFLQLFERALSLTHRPECGEPSHDETAEERSIQETGRHIRNMCLALVELIYSHVSRALYKTDRLTFGMHLAHNLSSTGKPSSAELTYFLKYHPDRELPVDTDFVSNEQAAAPEWVPAERIRAYNHLKAHFPGLLQSLNMQSSRTWSPWMSSVSCEAEFPNIAMSHTSFQRLLLIQALRPERLESAMQMYVRNALKLNGFFTASAGIRGLCPEETLPILLITAPGADPSQELEEFAVQRVGKRNYHQLAMGQGQAQEALRIVREGAKAGSWVCLKNLHLVVSWLPELERETHHLSPHPNFRLWLTSEPHEKFPQSLLQAALKVTCEAPQGFKNKLQCVYDVWAPSSESPKRNPRELHLLFLLTFLHAAVQERCAYIPQGWTKFYEFSFADLRFAADLIRTILREEGQLSLTHIQGLLHDVIYGGRVDNKVDSGVLQAYVRKYFSALLVATNCKQVRVVLDDSGQLALIPSTGGLQGSLSSSYNDYAEAISDLPDEDSPAILGLPANVSGALQQKSTDMVMNQLRAMSTITSTTDDSNKKALLNIHLSPLIHLYSSTMPRTLAMVNRSLVAMTQIPHPFPKRHVFPIHTFLRLELELALDILYAIQQDLSAVCEAFKSNYVALTPKALEICQTLVSGKVLDSWAAHWEGPADPLEYVKSSMLRASTICKYCDMAAANGLQVKSLNLCLFFHPHAFLSALCQQAAWSLQTTLDQLKLVTLWDAFLLPQTATSDPVTATLQIEGATFDGISLSRMTPGSPPMSLAPPCVFAWTKADSSPAYSSFISVPLYETYSRAKLVAEVQLPCSVEEKQEWLLAGIAFFLPLLPITSASGKASGLSLPSWTRLV